MIKLKRTDSTDKDFISLVRDLDADLAKRDGADHSFYAQFNKIDRIKFAVVAYDDGTPVGCGAIKENGPDAMEIKRMFVTPASRGKGVAGAVLAELEKWAAELSFTNCLLETGKRQPEAIRLYTRNGYLPTPNYGQYIGIENSLCFRKEIK
jgi:putative acetyltransferase